MLLYNTSFSGKVAINLSFTNNAASNIKNNENEAALTNYLALKDLTDGYNGNNLFNKIARNNSIKYAKGKYLAFLDSDDLWISNKLALQINFMKNNNFNFTFTSYMMIDEKSSIIKNSLIQSLQKISYDDMLSENIIGCLTVIYNQEKLGKLYMPNIRKRQDYGLWFKILKNEKFAYGMKESLAYYRIGQSSLSKNKFDLIKWNWILFHKVEKHSLFKSSYYLLLNIFNKVKKDIILNQKTK